MNLHMSHSAGARAKLLDLNELSSFIGRSLSRALIAGSDRLLAGIERARDLDRLRDMNDRELKDIGLVRGDLARVGGPVGRDRG